MGGRFWLVAVALLLWWEPPVLGALLFVEPRVVCHGRSWADQLECLREDVTVVEDVTAVLWTTHVGCGRVAVPCGEDGLTVVCVDNESVRLECLSTVTAREDVGVWVVPVQHRGETTVPSSPPQYESPGRPLAGGGIGQWSGLGYYIGPAGIGRWPPGWLDPVVRASEDTGGDYDYIYDYVLTLPPWNGPGNDVSSLFPFAVAETDSDSTTPLLLVPPPLTLPWWWTQLINFVSSDDAVNGTGIAIPWWEPPGHVPISPGLLCAFSPHPDWCDEPPAPPPGPPPEPPTPVPEPRTVATLVLVLLVWLYCRKFRQKSAEIKEGCK